MSIESELTRLINAKNALRSWLVSKGITVSEAALLPEMVELLDNVSGTTEQSVVTVSNSVGVNITVVSPYGSRSISDGGSATVTVPRCSLVAVAAGAYYAYPKSGGTLVYTHGSVRYGQVFFVKATDSSCDIITSKNAFV